MEFYNTTETRNSLGNIDVGRDLWPYKFEWVEDDLNPKFIQHGKGCGLEVTRRKTPFGDLLTIGGKDG